MNAMLKKIITSRPDPDPWLDDSVGPGGGPPDRVGPLARLVRMRRNELGLSVTDLAARAEMARSYISMIEHDKTQGPPSDAVVRRLARALRGDEAEMLQVAAWQRTPGRIRDQVQRANRGESRAEAEVRHLIEHEARPRNDGLGKSLDRVWQKHKQPPASAQKQTAEEGEPAQSMEQSEGQTDARPSEGAGGDGGVSMLRRIGRVVPLINKISAGYPCGFTDLDYPARVADEYVPVPDLGDPEAFAATVSGGSMLPDYREGDIVVFSPLADVVEACDCFVRIEPEHETTFKRIYFREDDQGRLRIRLQPLNPSYEPRVLGREQVAGLYRAVWKMSAV